jgi:hypothetical protein
VCKKNFSNKERLDESLASALTSRRPSQNDLYNPNRGDVSPFQTRLMLFQVLPSEAVTTPKRWPILQTFFFNPTDRALLDKDMPALTGLSAETTTANSGKFREKTNEGVVVKITKRDTAPGCKSSCFTNESTLGLTQTPDWLRINKL